MSTPRSQPPTRRPATPAGPVPRIGQRRPVRNPPGHARATRARPGRAGIPAARSARRLRVSVLGIVALLAVLGGRLVQLQGIEATSYASRAEALRVHTIVLPASRGAILDRSGRPLAQDLDLRLVYADPSMVGEEAGTIDATANTLASLLNIPSTTIAAKLRTPHTEYVKLKDYVDIPTATSIAKLLLPGIGVVRESKRVDPDGDIAGALVGKVGPNGAPLSGIELNETGILKGTDGSSTEERDPSGRVIPGGESTEVPAVDGSDVQLTIDADLQWYAQQVLAKQVAASAASGGQVIVMDRATGAVLALASDPSFDPSKPVTSAAQLDIPSLSTPYEPGSVNKVITTAAGLDAGVVTPSTALTIPNRYAVKGRGTLVQDAEDHSTEQLTLTGMLAKSSNIGAVQVEQLLGRDRFGAALSSFGLGQLTGVGLAGESPGLLPDEKKWNVAQETTIAFGQGMSATGLQIASVYATIANGGVRAAPQLIADTVSPDGTVHPAAQAAPRRVVSAKAAAELTAMMEQVTTVDGTAPKAAIPGVRIAGKTGTAQEVVNGAYASYVGSFAGFAPAEDPRFVVSVTIDNPTNGSHFGGEVAAPVFAQVMGFALREFKVVPDGTASPVLPLCWGARVGCSAS